MPAALNESHYAGELATQTTVYADKGRREAGQHRPPSDSVRPDQHETELRIAASQWLTTEQHHFDRVLTEAQRSAVDIDQKLVELDHRIAQLVADTSLNSSIDAEMSADRESLIAATMRQIQAEVDLRVFRGTNHITDQAVYPDSHVFHFAIIMVLALVETGVNAFFYENSQGLLGGFVVALGIAVLNMGTAVLLGMGFSFRNLAAPEKKAFGWACLVLFVVLTIFFNNLFATFRSAYQLVVDPSDYRALRQAMTASWGPALRVFVGELHFEDMLSFVLFGIGLLLSFFAFYKGMTFDDRYPGHGRRDRSLKAAQEARHLLQGQLLEKVKAFLHRRRAELQEVAHEPAVLINRATARKGELQQAQSVLEGRARAVQHDFTLVLGAYRETNTATRGTDPPAYFKETPNLTDQVSAAAAAGVLAQLDTAQANITQLRDARQDELNRHINQHSNNAADVLNSTYSAFLKDVEQEAKARITARSPAIDRALTSLSNGN